jgi:hypothetical protein
MIRFFILSISLCVSCLALYSCSSAGTVQKTDEMDLIAQVLKNYEPDFRYCITITNKNEEYMSDLLLLPSGMVMSSKITTKSGVSDETTKCMESVLNRVIFPPVKDKKAKQIKRELIFTEIK